MLQGRLTPFEGALVELKERRFDFIAKTERLLQPIALANCSRRTVTKEHVTDLRMLRLCKIRRHSWE